MGMFDRILVPLDGSRLSECTIPHAAALGRAFGSDVTLIHVLEPQVRNGRGSSMGPLSWHLERAEAEEYLSSRVQRLAGVDLSVEGIVVEGEAAESITRYAHQERFDLIVLSSHGEGGLSRWNVSSVARKVTSGAHSAVMLARAYLPTAQGSTGLSYRRLLAALDGSRRAEIALSAVETLAHAHSADVILACAVSRPAVVCRAPLSRTDIDLVTRLVERNRGTAADYLQQLPRWLSVEAETHLLDSVDVAESLQQLVKDAHADLVVISARAFSPDSRWPYGSVTESLISYGGSHLLIIQDLEASHIRQTPAQVAVAEVGQPVRSPLRSRNQARP